MYPAAVHPDGSYVGPADLFGGAVVARPVNVGGTFLSFGSGFGRGVPHPPAAQIVTSPVPLEAASRINFFIAGARANATYAGLISSGLDQFNIVVPQVPPGDQMFEAEIAGARSQSNLYLCVGVPGPVDLSVGATSLNFTAAQGGPAPAPQSVAVTSNVSNTGFTTRTQTDSGGSWLSATPWGAAPGSINITTTSTGLAPGTYTGAVFVSTCVVSGPRKINVTLTVTGTTGGGGGGGGAAPRITSVNPRSAAVGSTVAIEITGTGLESAFRINFFQPFGITVSNVQATATKVTATVRIDGSATPGNRNVSVSTNNGESNSDQFSILASGSAPPPGGAGNRSPTISNVNLSSVANANNATINITMSFTDPDGDIRYVTSPSGPRSVVVVTPLVPQNTNGCADVYGGTTLEKPGQTSGSIVLSNTFPFRTELRNLEVAVILIDAAGNSSNVARLTVPTYHTDCVFTAPVSRAPTISNAQISSVANGNQATRQVGFDFTDPDGDIRNNGVARFELFANHPSNTAGCFEFFRSAILEKPGQTTGTISLNNTSNFATELRGNFTVDLTLVDAAGNRSNTLRVPMTVFHTLCQIPTRDPVVLRYPLEGGASPR